MGNHCSKKKPIIIGNAETTKLPAPCLFPLDNIKSNEEFKVNYSTVNDNNDNNDNNKIPKTTKIYKITWTVNELEFSNHIRLIYIALDILNIKQEEINTAIINYALDPYYYSNIDRYAFMSPNKYKYKLSNDDWEIVCRYMTIFLSKYSNLPSEYGVSGDTEPCGYGFIFDEINDYYYKEYKLLEYFIIEDIKDNLYNSHYLKYKKGIQSLKFIASKKILYDIKRSKGYNVKSPITNDSIKKELNSKIPNDLIDYINNLI
jgi:hypothetical protein